jgi:hypothetical protein
MDMTSSQRWFAIESRGEPGVDLDSGWHLQFREREICPECKSRLLQFRAAPVNVVLDCEPDSAPVMDLDSAWLARTDFLDRFRGLTDRYLVQGTAHDASGKLYSGYVTYTTEYPLPMRGNGDSVIGACGRCGDLRYFPKPFGYYYIFAGDLLPGRLLYTASFYPLVVAEDVLSRIDPRTRRLLKIKEIPVRDTPEDGLGKFPPCSM